MNLLKLYTEILATGLMSVNDEGLVSQPSKYTLGGTVPIEPTLIDGKRLVLPTQKHVDQPDPEEKIIFHPLSENALQGESAVITKLKTMNSVVINMTILNLVSKLIELALSTEEHKKLNPDQSELLSILKNADEKTEKDFMKIVLSGIRKEGAEGLFFKVFLKRGGTVMGKKYARVGVVSFPLYEELTNGENEHYGVTLRKKDHGVFAKLLEYILPRIAESHAYDVGSDDDTAPYLDALMQSVASVGVDINARIAEFENLITYADELKIKMGWRKAFKDLSDFTPEIRRIPAQYGNRGNRRVDEQLKEEHNIQSAVDSALHRSEAVAEVPMVAKAAPVTVPPWEHTPVPVVASVPSLSVPMVAPPPVASAPGTISALELLGIMPGQPAYPPQGYPPGYGQQGGYPPGYPQQPGYGYPQQRPGNGFL
mgnify:CR=1 FL=1